LNGSFGKEISDELARTSNIRILLYMPSAFRSFLNSKREIRKPEDMKAMKIRTMEVPLHVEMVKALGASPTPIPWDELYSALQTGVVDGCESVPYLVVSAKLLEVQKFYTLNNHVMNCPLVIISDKFYKSLSPDDRQIFEYAAREALLAFLGTITAKEVRDIEVIKKAGVKVYVPTPQEIAQFEKPVREPIVQVLRKLGVEQKWIDKMFKAIAESEKIAGWRK
jgi:TRAP-type C4-dicarboxylate transport system substrate-binding protein